ncbi:MAG: hypothetical protein ACYCVU_10080, partial [Gammaproteobacteria bacterium]
ASGMFGSGGWAEAGQVAVLSTVGGTASALSGGSFENGAISTAFQVMFNSAEHAIQKHVTVNDAIRKAYAAHPGACNIFLEGVAHRLGIRLTGTAGEMYAFLVHHGYLVNQAVAEDDAKSRKYLVIAAETKAQLSQSMGHVAVLWDGRQAGTVYSHNWKGLAPLGQSVSIDPNSYANFKTIEGEGLNWAFPTRPEYFAIPVPGSGG